MQQRGKRPLTDLVVVAAPDIVAYDIDFTYYINISDINKAVQVQQKVSEAVNQYKLWQSEKIGRDINPDELTALLNKAGVKRAEIASPEFTVLKDIEVAVLSNINIIYGGLEND